MGRRNSLSPARRLVLALLAFGAGTAALPARAAAQGGGQEHDQGFFERLGFDKLSLTALGVAVGTVHAARVEPTESYAITADYGELAPGVRVVFTAGYWGSQFRREVVQRFLDQIRTSLSDTTAAVRYSAVSISDISLEADFRWVPRQRGVLRPYAGVGFGAHVINAEGVLIRGTFVESALDNIAFGPSALAGLDIALGSAVHVGVEGRYSMISTVRFGALRAGASYHFHLRSRS